MTNFVTTYPPIPGTMLKTVRRKVRIPRWRWLPRFLWGVSFLGTDTWAIDRLLEFPEPPSPGQEITVIYETTF